MKAFTIAWKDFKSYFASPIGYLIISAFMLIMGWFFFFVLNAYVEQNINYARTNMGKPVSLTNGIIVPFYGNMNIVLLFLIPFVTMRLFSEERKNHTIELLLTSPVKFYEMVIGKFLSGVYLLLVILGLTMIYPLIIIVTGNPEIGSFVTSYLGSFFMACCYLALGVLFSSLTENQIIAGALTFIASLFFWLIGWASYSLTGFWGDLVGYFSLMNHYRSFSSGLLNSSDVVFFLSFIGTGLFLTHRVLDSYRWR